MYKILSKQKQTFLKLLTKKKKVTVSLNFPLATEGYIDNDKLEVIGFMYNWW